MVTHPSIEKNEGWGTRVVCKLKIPKRLGWATRLLIVLAADPEFVMRSLAKNA